MRPFARMAAISPETGAGEILPALARNVVTNGYQASHSNEALEPTEYLKLVAALSRILRDESVKAALLAAPTDADFRSVLARGVRP